MIADCDCKKQNVRYHLYVIKQDEMDVLVFRLSVSLFKELRSFLEWNKNRRLPSLKNFKLLIKRTLVYFFGQRKKERNELRELG